MNWLEINNVIPKTKKDVPDQIIWNNSFIKINNASVYYESWHQAGVTKLSTFVGENKTQLLSFPEFLKKFKIKGNFLQCFGLTSTNTGKVEELFKRRRSN